MKKWLQISILAACAFAAEPYTVWKNHLGGPDSPQYSALRQIDRRNVAGLEQVWFYPAGDNGLVNLRVGLGRDPDTMRRVQSGDPGRVFENLMILGSAPGESYESPPGDLRAYDTRTGKLVWTFHTVPHPGEPGYETWPPDAGKYNGGPNTWDEISI